MPYQDWNEVLVDNWKVVGIVYGGVGRYGVSQAQVMKLKSIGKAFGLRVSKMGSMI